MPKGAIVDKDRIRNKIEIETKLNSASHQLSNRGTNMIDTTAPFKFQAQTYLK